MPNAIDLIKQDHRKVEQLFKEFEKAKSPNKKQEIVRETLQELAVHAMVEEELFYPAAREVVGDELVMDEAEEEHLSVKLMMVELSAMEPNEPHYDAKFHVLMEQVTHHVEEEEKDILPKSEKIGERKLEELGSQIEELKPELMQRAEQALKGELGEDMEDAIRRISEVMGRV